MSLTDAARDLGLPLSTAHRMATTLEEHGFLTRIGRGRYQGGIALLRSARLIDPVALLARAARPALRRLADEVGRTAHLGIFEHDMITYVVREACATDPVFTRESMQLEAYCSAVGKVVLAGLPEETLTRYLAQGPFVPLTARTIVDPAALKAHLAEVAEAGHAVDDEEIEAGLFCLAIPLATPAELPDAALSLAGPVTSGADRERMLYALASTAEEITAALAAPGSRRYAYGSEANNDPDRQDPDRQGGLWGR